MWEISIPVESFFNCRQAREFWPEEIVKNEIFMRQIKQRGMLNRRLSDIIKSLPRPDIHLEAAINQGLVAENQIAELYDSLSDLLSDDEYKRLILYLPFEFLPTKMWHTSNGKLQQVISRFKRTYIKTWKRLLWVHNVRANFVDGDVMEVGWRASDPPRVVKAAHLIPKLIEHGLIKPGDVFNIMEETDDQTLKDSIADGLSATGIETPRSEIIAPLPSSSITKNRAAWLQRREKEKAIDYTQKHLAGPFSKNLKLMKEEIGDISRMLASIGTNHELSKFIYPVVLIYGSRLNGYGEQSADIDLGVFIRPKTPLDKRAKLKELLKATFSHEKIKSHEIVEFWLKEKGDLLNIREIKELDSDLSFGKALWTYVLFGAAWMGDKKIMLELYKRLLVPYMRDNGQMIGKHRTRDLYIEDMEHSALQYRLMHKGYGRFLPRYIGISAPSADRVDGKSMFWDSGYRQLATKLFISRVFLPKI